MGEVDVCKFLERNTNLLENPARLSRLYNNLLKEVIDKSGLSEYEAEKLIDKQIPNLFFLTEIEQCPWIPYGSSRQSWDKCGEASQGLFALTKTMSRCFIKNQPTKISFKEKI